MKNVLTLALIMSCIIGLNAQNAIQSELFSTDLVLKYRSELELSDTQVDKVKSIYQAHITEFNSMKWDLDAEMVALGKILSQAKVDEKQSSDQMDKVIALEDKLKRMRISMLVKIKNQLNAEQQTTLKSLRTDSDFTDMDLNTSMSDDYKVSIKVKGKNSKDSKPLVIIKGKKTEKAVAYGKIKDIDTSDIESVNVLKGQNAIEMYGEKGKNGVIIITIKN